MNGREPEPPRESNSNDLTELGTDTDGTLSDEQQTDEAEISSQVSRLPSGSGPNAIGSEDLNATLIETDGHSLNVATQASVFGEYELLHEIARGGMGVVYKARHRKLNRVVALKMILAGQLASSADVQRFYIEAEAAAKLEHPGIVPIFQIGETDGQHFFSMGFVNGPSLADRVRNGPMPPRDAAAMTMQIAEAIAHAHENKVVHRDLKPANILIDADGQPKVTDFGLAKKVEAADSLTASGQILGTPGYMPPEQASGGAKHIGPTADVYSLGAILYALLTGRAPFQADSVMDTLVQVVEQEPIRPRHYTQGIDRDLERICLKCLAKSPEDRYQSANQLNGDLRRFLDGDPLSISSMTSIGHVMRQLRRSKHDAQFGQWGIILCWLTPVIMAAETGMYFLCRNGPPYAHSRIVTLRIVQCLLLVFVAWKFRKKWYTKIGTIERQLLVSCFGFIASCFSVLVTEKLGQSMGHIHDELMAYVFLLLLSGLFFSSLAANYWGQCHTISVAFYIAAPLVLFNLSFAPLVFGGMWAVALLIIGVRLLRYDQSELSE